MGRKLTPEKMGSMFMGRKLSPEKWGGMKESYISWWDSLTIEEKTNAKKKFSLQCLANEEKRYSFPDMWDLSNIRVSQLSNKHIYRIWVFKDYNENLQM